MFLRGLGGDIILGVRDNIGYAYHTDVRGSITNIWDDWGNVVTRTAYDAYGNASVDYDAFESSLGYTGAVRDQETGLLYLSARYYDPETSRFISEDPARDGQSWYMYCAGDPVNKLDLTGLKPLTVRGSKGQYVKEIQKRMNAIKIGDKNGMALKVDGDFGERTETAVKKFQSINGLTVDGKVGNNTWGLIDKPIKFNCYGYAINTFTDIEPKPYDGKRTYAKVLADCKRRLGTGNVRGIDSRTSSMSSNEYRVAVRANNGVRFHFMKQDTQGMKTGYWSEKHGWTEMRYYDYNINPDEGPGNGLWSSKSGAYSKPTKYLAIKFKRK